VLVRELKPNVAIEPGQLPEATQEHKQQQLNLLFWTPEQCSPSQLSRIYELNDTETQQEKFNPRVQCSHVEIFHSNATKCDVEVEENKPT